MTSTLRLGRFRPMLLATTALLAGGTTAFAQQAGGATEEAVVLEPITVIASKRPEPVIDALGGVSVVGPEEIARRQASEVTDLLRDIPGVSTQNLGKEPGQAIAIRGLQDFGRVNVLVDGARQDYQISGHGPSGSFFLDPAFLSQVDIVRGPIANIYGSGAIGGVAAFTTRGVEDVLTPDERWGIEQQLGFNTSGLGMLTSTSMAARVGTMADFYGQFVYRRADDYRDGSGTRVRDSSLIDFGGLLKANFRPADGHTISLSALVQHFSYDSVTRFGSRPTLFDNKVDTGTYTVGYRFEDPTNPWVSLNAKLYLTQTKFEQTVTAPGSLAFPPFPAPRAGVGAKITDEINTWGFDIANTSRFETGLFAHALTFGGDGSFDRVETKDGAGGFTAAFTPSGDRTLLGAFVQDEIRYGGWLRVLGGLRFDSYELEGGRFRSDGTHVSPKITLGITPFQGIEVYGTYAEGYRAPSISETLISGNHPPPAVFPILPNPALRPEVAHTLEAGVNLKFDNVFRDGDRIRGKVTGFVNQVDDYIDQVSIPRMGIPAIQYQNIASAVLTGVEVEGLYDWGGGFVSLAATHIEGRNDTTDAPLNSVSPDKISTTGALRFFDESLTLGTRLTFVAASEKTVTVPSRGYGLVDVFASYKYDDNLSAAVAVDNVFDRRYKPYLASDPAPGIAAKFSLTMKLGGK